MVKPDDCLPLFDMTSDQNKDEELLELKTIHVHGEPSKEGQRKYHVVGNVVYYLTDPDGDTALRLYVPKHLRAVVVKQ